MFFALIPPAAIRVIGIHNFPEGIATFTAAVKDPHLGIAIAIAIAIHNIPEGIAVAVPIYYATCDMRKAFRLSFLSGLSEPVGALIGFLFLMPILTETVFGALMAAIAGIMVFISFDELLPTAREYDEHHLHLWLGRRHAGDGDQCGPFPVVCFLSALKTSTADNTSYLIIRILNAAIG